MNIYFYDSVVAGVLVVFILLSVWIVNKKGKIKWINRKFIHISSISAAICYYYVFHEPYVFSFMCFLLFFIMFFSRVKKNLTKNIQIKRNYGELYYCLVWGLISVIFWKEKVLVFMIMVAMAIGDGVTGFIRYYFSNNKKRHKGIQGSIFMFLVCFIVFLMVSHNIITSFFMSLIASLMEYQSLIDDNLAIPIGMILVYFII